MSVSAHGQGGAARRRRLPRIASLVAAAILASSAATAKQPNLVWKPGARPADERATRAWSKAIQRAVRKRWLLEIPDEAKAGVRGAVMLRFCILADGTIAHLEVVARKGPASFDEAALRAITTLSPLPPPPPFADGDGLRISYTFFYNVEGDLAEDWQKRATENAETIPKADCPGREQVTLEAP